MMTEVYQCKFNIDTGCVEVICADGRMISIDCAAVEDEITLSKTECEQSISVWAMKHKQYLMENKSLI